MKWLIELRYKYTSRISISKHKNTLCWLKIVKLKRRACFSITSKTTRVPLDVRQANSPGTWTETGNWWRSNKTIQNALLCDTFSFHYELLDTNGTGWMIHESQTRNHVTDPQYGVRASHQHLPVLPPPPTGNSTPHIYNSKLSQSYKSQCLYNCVYLCLLSHAFSTNKPNVIESFGFG